MNNKRSVLIMANRTRDYYRKMRKKAINKKMKIINSYRQDNPPAFYNADETDYGYNNSYGSISPYWYVKNKGMLSKGKIHCSCSLCSFHGTTAQDRRQLTSMESKLNDYCDDDESIYIPNLLTLKSKLKKEINGVYHPNTSCISGTTIDCRNFFDYSEYEKGTKRASLIDELHKFMYSLELYKKSYGRNGVSYYRIPSDSYKYMCHAVSKFLIAEDISVEDLPELSSVLNEYITENRLSKYYSFDSRIHIDVTSVYQVASILNKYL